MTIARRGRRVGGAGNSLSNVAGSWLLVSEQGPSIDAGHLRAPSRWRSVGPMSNGLPVGQVWPAAIPAPRRRKTHGASAWRPAAREPDPAGRAADNPTAGEPHRSTARSGRPAGRCRRGVRGPAAESAPPQPPPGGRSRARSTPRDHSSARRRSGQSSLAGRHNTTKVLTSPGCRYSSASDM